MQTSQHFLESTDGHQIFVRKWQPSSNKPIKGVFHINHGMAEHSERYAPFAEKLIADGYAVYAHDHRGHGYSIPQGGLVGHYADKNGWAKVISDLKVVNESIHSDYPDLPVILFGHSMGSFISLYYCTQHGDSVSAVILSGSGYSAPVALRAPKMLIRLEKFRNGSKARSNLIDRQTFASFNKRFGKPRTTADWLSRDEKEVDKYISDPLCGFLCTNQMWDDFLSGLDAISRNKNLRNIPNQVPFYLVSGERDPLSYGSRKHGIEKLAEHLRSGGQLDVTFKLYEDGRHEIFNELNREEVIKDTIAWANSRLNVTQPAKKREAATA